MPKGLNRSTSHRADKITPYQSMCCTSVNASFQTPGTHINTRQMQNPTCNLSTWEQAGLAVSELWVQVRARLNKYNGSNEGRCQISTSGLHVHIFTHTCMHTCIHTHMHVCICIKETKRKTKPKKEKKIKYKPRVPEITEIIQISQKKETFFLTKLASEEQT